MKPRKFRILCGFLLLLQSTAGSSQPAIEFANGSGSNGGGSLITNQVITFQNNALNPVTGTYVPLVPTTTATFTISNQQYVLPTTQNPNQADVSFGANVNGSGKTPLPALLFPPMNAISAPAAADFSATQNNIGTGMSMSSNYAVEMFTSAMGLYNANAPTNGTYYMADLTITFNLPVTDPVLHIVGMGGTYGALGMTSQLTLATTGVTLTKLSGSTEFSVTATTIVNTAANPTSTTGAGAASGSVMVNGTVTSLKFNIYLRGNGKTPAWSNATSHTGDAWMMGISAINTYTALPIGITDFTAENRNHSAALQWSENKPDLRYFAVQRSNDGQNWATIGQVPAAQIESSVPYNYVDHEPFNGTNYYRLQEIDANSIVTYSGVRDVNFTDVSPALSYYPNPVHDRLTITSASTIQSVMLTTLDGRTLQLFNGFSSGQSIDLSRYPFGIYFLVIRTADTRTHTATIERN